MQQFIEERIKPFHQSKLDELSSLELDTVLSQINPYLYKAQNYLTSGMIVRNSINAYISPIQEEKFDNWLKDIVYFVNLKAYGGWKSEISNIDLEFEDTDCHYIVVIKSWSSWGDVSKINSLKENFVNVMKDMRITGTKNEIKAIYGCCFGRNRCQDKGDYYKYSGEPFWQVISGSYDLFVDIIEPMGLEAIKDNDEYYSQMSTVINRFTRQFSEEFCKQSGEIDWAKLVKFNSGVNPSQSNGKFCIN